MILPMKLSKTDYRGGEALRLSTKAFEWVVTPSVGPRVVEFRSQRGDAGNMFFQFPENEKRAHGYLLRGGHRLWHSPEDIVRTYQPDDELLAVRMLKNGVALTQPTEQLTGLQKAITLEAIGDRTLKVTHALTNRGKRAVHCAPWALTMCRGGGYGVLPLLPKGDHAAGDLLPRYALVPWTYTDLALPVWEPHRDVLGIDTRKAKAPQKLGITNYPGWSAYWQDGTTFVKSARTIAGATYPDLGCCWETFTNGAMIEFETLGELGSLQPEARVTHVEYWTVIDGLPKPDADAAFAKLASSAKRWLAKL